MSSSRQAPIQGHRIAFVSCAALVAAAALTGCASGEARTPETQVRYSASPRYVAANGGYRAEIEDDGLPAQTPPPAVRRLEPDDPSEPYSPNYGRDSSEPAPPRKPLAASLAPPLPPTPVPAVRPARGIFAASR